MSNVRTELTELEDEVNRMIEIAEKDINSFMKDVNDLEIG